MITRRIPGPLIAVVLAIGVSRAAELARHGVAVVGPVPRGLPGLALPALGRHDAATLLGAAASLFVVILAQSAATSRAYAVRYEEAFSENTDLIGLGAANAAAVSTARTDSRRRVARMRRIPVTSMSPAAMRNTTAASAASGR